MKPSLNKSPSARYGGVPWNHGSKSYSHSNYRPQMVRLILHLISSFYQFDKSDSNIAVRNRDHFGTTAVEILSPTVGGSTFFRITLVR